MNTCLFMNDFLERFDRILLFVVECPSTEFVDLLHFVLVVKSSYTFILVLKFFFVGYRFTCGLLFYEPIVFWLPLSFPALRFLHPQLLLCSFCIFTS